jgi:hypothetical protein
MLSFIMVQEKGGTIQKHVTTNHYQKQENDYLYLP